MTYTQRNRYPETGCNGAPSLSIKTAFHVNFTETFSDGIRVFMNGNRRTLPHGTASLLLLMPGSRDTSNSLQNLRQAMLLSPLRGIRVVIYIF